MLFWKSLICYAHLIQNTFWEFHLRNNFDLSVQQVNEKWQQSLQINEKYEEVAKYAEFEALVYCNNSNEMAGIGRLNNYQILDSGIDEQNTHSWLIILSEDSLVVTLRGTNNKKEIWNDLDFRQSPLPCYMFPSSCQNKRIKVHHGFLTHLIYIGEQITNLVKIYQNLHPDKPLILTAHSLGAATAVLLLQHWQETKIKFHKSYLFGLPIVGNEEFAKQFTEINVLKIFNENDIVPTLGFIGGKHIDTPEIWIKDNIVHEHYQPVSCQQLSWEQHSRFYGIEINKNYCKLTYSRVKKSHRDDNKKLYIMFVCLVIVFIVIVTCAIKFIFR